MENPRTTDSLGLSRKRSAVELLGLASEKPVIYPVDEEGCTPGMAIILAAQGPSLWMTNGGRSRC